MRPPQPLAEHGFDSPADEAFTEWRDNSGAGDNPVVLQLLAVVGRNPDVADPAKAKARLNAIMADKGHAYWKGNRLACLRGAAAPSAGQSAHQQVTVPQLPNIPIEGDCA